MAEKETVIGAETRISGEIRGDEDLVIRGRVDGKIQLSSVLTVDKGAIVQADVDVRRLAVAGTLVGSIIASESVHLLATARVVGDLSCPRVIMDAGAAYRGRVEMGGIESGKAVAATHAVAKPVVRSSEAAASARPAPPRVAAPPRTAVVEAKSAPRFVAPPAASERSSTSASSNHPSPPPAFPRVAGAVGNAAPAWAKKKVRRR